MQNHSTAPPAPAPSHAPCAALIDIGINLGHDSYDGDRDAVLARARAAGVMQMLVTGAYDGFLLILSNASTTATDASEPGGPSSARPSPTGAGMAIHRRSR